MASYEQLMADDKVSVLIAELQGKYPGKRLRPIDTAAGVVVCINPSRPQYKMYLASIWSDDVNTQAQGHEVLMRAIVVHPDQATFGEWLDSYPGIAADKDVVKELRILAGAAKDDSVKR